MAGRDIEIFGFFYESLNAADHAGFRICSSRKGLVTGVWLDDFELKMQFLASTNRRQVELPKLPSEPKRVRTLIEIGEPLQSQHSPKIGKRYVSVYRSQLHSGVEGKWGALRHEAGEGITVEMISVRRVSSPIRVGAVGSNNLDVSAWFCNAVQLANE